MKKILLILLVLLPAMMMAQTFDFDLTKQQPVYNGQDGYGYDILPAPNIKKPTAEPFYFSVRVPDGNYRVRVELGGVKNGNTTVRAEGRRLLMDNILTPKKKNTQTVEFVVNKRSTLIEGNKHVKIKDREKDYLTWDDRLTLEFNGPQPAVRSIHIERDDQVPTIYLCGNSTVVDQNDEPWASWGQMITRWFGPEVAVSNHAESGLTCRTFIASFRLDKILSTLKAGDYVFVEFGHNDEKEHQPGDGAWYHYQYQLKIFVDQVRAKGAEIVFLTPTQRRAFDDDRKTLKNTHGDFPAAMKEVAERERVPLIDLNAMTKTFFETLGFEDSKRALVHYPANTFPDQPKELADNTHFNPYGAYEVAKCVVTGMKQLNLPLVQYLRPEWQDFDPAQPDDWHTFQWAPAKNANLVKPDGN
jgi:lysophospholipase L1-like esterase